MTNIIHNISEKLTTTKAAPNHPVAGSPKQSEEQTFGILPHPAKTNDPADLQNSSERTGGMRSGQGPFEAFKTAPGLVQPTEEMLKRLPPAKSREELEALQAQLNK